MGSTVLDGGSYRTFTGMGGKKNLGIVRPILTARCMGCGKWFAKSHPKDKQVLCERCRNERVKGR